MRRGGPKGLCDDIGEHRGQEVGGLCTPSFLPHGSVVRSDFIAWVAADR
jgi:hypothetical protein